MGKKVNKGFLFYLLLLLGAVLAGFVIWVVILVTVPGTDMFGLSYFKERESTLYDKMTVYATKEDEQSTGDKVLFRNASYPIENIEIVSNLYSIDIFESNSTDGVNYTEFHININTDLSGFTTDRKELDISVNYYQDTKTLKIQAITPDGFWVTGNTSSISVQIPSTFDASNINLNVDAGKGSINVGDSKYDANLEPNVLELKSANLKANSLISITEYALIGSGSLKDNCSFESAGGAISINSKITANNVTIKGHGSNFKFNQNGEAFAAANINVEITEGTYIYFGTINATNITLKNTYGKVYFSDITGSVVVSADSKKCDYEFKNITGDLTVGNAAVAAVEEVSPAIPEKKTEGCNIKVEGTISGVVDIHTTGTVTPATLVA